MFTLKQQRPLYLLFPGLGGQWVGMAKGLMPIKIFAERIEECHKILEPYGVDLKHLLLSDDKNSMSTMTNKFCATTAIEIALFDVFKALDVVPDGIIGHSFGEIAAAYADGCLSAKEALLVTYFRGVVTESDKKIPKGLMAVLGMTWNEAKKLCPKGTSVVCNNGKDTVVVSGIKQLLFIYLFIYFFYSQKIFIYFKVFITRLRKWSKICPKKVFSPENYRAVIYHIIANT
jgi:fatty acid synthase